jgi:hypothetical protein
MLRIALFAAGAARTLPSSNVNEPASPILNVLLHLPGRYMSVLRT